MCVMCINICNVCIIWAVLSNSPIQENVFIESVRCIQKIYGIALQGACGAEVFFRLHSNEKIFHIIFFYSLRYGSV